eukprot:5676378-Heterocapsa_arctica.AAC.1
MEEREEYDKLLNANIMTEINQLFENLQGKMSKIEIKVDALEEIIGDERRHVRNTMNTYSNREAAKEEPSKPDNKEETGALMNDMSEQEEI